MTSRMLFLLSLAAPWSVMGARLGLHKAAEQGQVAPLKVAIDGYWDEYNDRRVKPDLNGHNKKGRVALHLATCNDRGDIAAVRAILEKGADANARDGQGLTALHTTIHCNNWKKLAMAAAKLLVKHGADVNAASTSDGLTALHMSVANGNIKMVEFLVSKGAALNALDVGGATPLHHAARNQNARETFALLKAGADPNIADKDGQLPRDAVTGSDSISLRIRNDLNNAATIRSEAIEQAKRATTKSEKAAAAGAGAASPQDKNEL
eukprot:CAMPEP_0119302120 /NCGR_PEP_ID=MMETSP1333-20130426/3782_1 /TAXON_ID=418940 /ORGANISM="Scyphosphaera apsteinii, Strain RCC1455" /LENGTH=264 /DNA_ID=CAMNT_0007304383 /DNA_START=14 /DNA_END=808 /DNA_ORIENTATION=-